MSTLIKGKRVGFTASHLVEVELEDGRIILTPLSWYPELVDRTSRELDNCHFICLGTGIEWPELDIQICI